MSRSQRRESLLDAAATLVTETGLEAVTIERIANRCDISRALIYSYYSNSDELLAALFEREVGALDQRVLARMNGLRGTEVRFHAAMSAVHDVVREKALLLGRLFQTHRADGALSVARRNRQAFVRDFFARQMHDELGVPLPRARIAAGIWLAAVNGALMQAISDGESADELLQIFSRMAVSSVRALADMA